MTYLSSFSLFIFDRSCRTPEGEEHRKVLCYFPQAEPNLIKSSVGLAEGMLNFSEIFSPNFPCETIHAKKHRQILFECESNLWIVLAVPYEVISKREVRDGALKALLQETYQLVHLLLESIRPKLTEDGGGSRARVCEAMKPIFADTWGRLTSSRKGDLAGLNPLSGREGVPLLPLPRSTFLNVQFIVNLLENLNGGKIVKHSMILHDNQLVWSSLQSIDSVVLHQYFLRCLLPSLASPSTAARLRSTLQITGGSLMGKAAHQPAEISASLPPFRAGEWKTTDNYFVVPTSNSHQDHATPFVHLSNGSRLRMIIYQHENVTLLLLVDGNVLRDHSLLGLRSQVGSILEERVPALDASLSEHFSGMNRWHISGYRYLFVDRPFKTVRCSPESKVGTLGRESLTALSSVRADLDHHIQHEARQSGAGARENYREICVRTYFDSWVVVRRSRQRELYVVLERSGETLMEAHELVQHFSESSFGGIFDTE